MTSSTQSLCDTRNTHSLAKALNVTSTMSARQFRTERSRVPGSFPRVQRRCPTLCPGGLLSLIIHRLDTGRGAGERLRVGVAGVRARHLFPRSGAFTVWVD